MNIPASPTPASPPSPGDHSQSDGGVEQRTHIEQALDDALDETFPASDPIASQNFD